MKIGIIGCGNMGGGMAANLVNLKQDVTCFDSVNNKNINNKKASFL